MNRFRTKKKTKDDTPDPEQNTMPSFKGFLRGRKAQEEEPKKKLDLEHALPSHDEFRTSLLMTGLSARFSMLREQDDPNTKIGKASDDSVLFPKRQSRLMDFGYGGGLTDIAEVESIKAPFTRMDSFDDTNSTKGSIMDRGKPTEGNNLFGGRQKIVVGNRTLYENDVATSSFQKWRREEKERKMLNGEYDGEEFESPPVPDARRRPSEEDSFATRSESPLLGGYNRRRETSSTTSSSFARNSTAATSIASQPPPSIKDWQSQSTAPPSASATAALDRSVTRTRRLYEQSLTQDMHDQQSSALSRIDTLTGRRGFGSRTPDLSNNAPSPTGFGFGDRRPILTKASAPNLRSTSPPATSSSAGTPDLGIKASNNFIGSPPLSPPISETGDFGALPIQPNDRGKATAMGVFQKPAQPYDESKYAERQLRLQQGRETPTQRARAESSTTGRSRSSSSAQRQQLAPKTSLTIQTATSDQIYSPVTFLDDSDASPLPAELQTPASATSAPKLTLQRPSDKDHPAFRQAALPTPLSLDDQTSGDASPVFELREPSLSDSRKESPIDSPTLGPTTTGLSGMVRQHMRSESNTSSIYGAQSSGLDSRFPADTRDSSIMGVLGTKVNGWQDQQWNPYQEDAIPERSPRDEMEESESREKLSGGRGGSETPSNRSSNDMGKEEDEFASQLANARRRVQQRLTSYVESDSSRSSSPHAPADVARDAIPPARPNGLGILRGKSSRGSLVERNRDASQSKAMKMLGIGVTTISTSPSPGRTSFEDVGLPPMKEEESAPVPDVSSGQMASEKDSDAVSANSQDKDEENVHPGLRAFRQARRNLQKRRELETLARHQPQMQGAADDANPVPERDTTRARRAPSRDRKPPPVYYQQRAPSEESYRSAGNSRGPSRPESRTTERDRSGSDTSNGRSHSRPPRLQPNAPYDDHVQGGGGSYGPGSGPRPPMMRSPGLPGTDIRRSPIMPPQPYPHASSPRRFDRSESAGSLAPQSHRGGLEPVSPVQLSSPLTPNGTGLPPSPFMNGGNGGPGAVAPRRPSAPQAPSHSPVSSPFSTTTSTLNESMKRVVKKKDISDPTFVMGTSRVPTVPLPINSSSEGARSRSGSRGRAGSNASAAGYNPPPLPPINPRRKQQDGPRGPGFMDSVPSPSNYSAPHLPFSSSTGSSVGGRSSPVPSSPRGGRDDHGDEHRWRLRQQNNEAHTLNSSGSYPSMRDARAAFAAAPPVGRSVVTPSIKAPGAAMGVPGGLI